MTDHGIGQDPSSRARNLREAAVDIRESAKHMDRDYFREIRRAETLERQAAVLEREALGGRA